MFNFNLISRKTRFGVNPSQSNLIKDIYIYGTLRKL